MYINKYTTVTGKKVILVPYKEEHVLKYHGWMKSQELQALTASEPLTLDEEYQMQKSWQMDENKLTFIVLDKGKYEETQSEVDSMIGDTNLFFSNGDDRLCAEAEIMIAEQWARGRKCGWEAMLLMLLYGVTYLSVKQTMEGLIAHRLMKCPSDVCNRKTAVSIAEAPSRTLYGRWSYKKFR